MDDLRSPWGDFVRGCACDCICESENGLIRDQAISTVPRFRLDLSGDDWEERVSGTLVEEVPLGDSADALSCSSWKHCLGDRSGVTVSEIGPVGNVRYLRSEGRLGDGTKDAAGSGINIGTGIGGTGMMTSGPSVAPVLSKVEARR